MQEKDPEPRSSPAWVTTLGMFGVIVADIAGYTGAGIFLGWLLQSKLGWPWWVIVVTSLTGLAMAMYRLYKMSNLIQ